MDSITNVADIGANIGLHSIILSRCGYNVTSYEPDPIHFKILKQNLKLNEIKNAKLINAAVSDKDGFSIFVRVIGNSTSSHLEGSKDNAYGDLEKFEVKTIHIDSVFKDIDFIKMDVEGAEGKIILSTGSEHWATTEMLLEVGNEKNASVIFSHLKKIGINAFSQKNGWAIVKTLDDFPKSYKEGSLFISNKDYMSWL
ncbi:FkbM family methyltransferase [bacterium]|nr:FkbM family methyltransferase [bacterium]